MKMNGFAKEMVLNEIAMLLTRSHYAEVLIIEAVTEPLTGFRKIALTSLKILQRISKAILNKAIVHLLFSDIPYCNKPFWPKVLVSFFFNVASA